MTAIRKMGIVGVGPRGGYALERLVVELAQQNSLFNIQIALFESTGCFGNGIVYDTHQSSSNWINITERALELEQRVAIQTDGVSIPAFPSYHEVGSTVSAAACDLVARKASGTNSADREKNEESRIVEDDYYCTHQTQCSLYAPN
jgi:hypothetical protein